MDDFLERVLRATAFNGTDGLWWRTSDDGEDRLQVFANCNDFFWWACADLEEITPDNIEVLEKAQVDLLVLEDSYADCYIHLLFCARIRKMRPQGAYYKHLPEEMWPLLNTCGPEREIDFGNPKPQPEKEELKDAITNA